MEQDSPAGSAGVAGGPWWKSAVTWVKVLAISILAAALYLSFNTRSSSSAGSLPSFELPLLSGGVLKNEDLEGKVTILNFFATWCGPCKMEMPELNRFAEKHVNDKVALIGVSAGNEHRLEIRPFVEQFKVKFPIAVEGEALLMRLGSEALPTTVVIDPEGNVAQVVRGMVTEEWLEQQVKHLASGHRD